MLSNYFSPHTVLNILVLFVSLICFDITGIGLVLLLKIKSPPYVRYFIWVIGLGVTVFLGFIQHLFLPYRWYFTYPEIVLPAAFFFRTYIKSGHLHHLWSKILHLFPLVLLLLPLAPYIYIKTSLPPYTWDEMAYHYYSPAKLLTQQKWVFDGLYYNLPRMLDTAFIQLFSLTGTYATARLLHFGIFLSTLVCTYSFFGKHISKLGGLLAVFLLTYLSPDLMQEAALGYVDVATACFIFLSFMMLLEYLLTSNRYTIPLYLFFSSLALGTKYSALAPIGISMLLFLIIWLTKHRKKIHFSSVAVLIPYLVTAIVLGGYWYLKNFIVTGNPIYPFFLPCWHGQSCGVNQSFFFWATPLALSSVPTIISQISLPHIFFVWVTIPLFIVGFMLSNRKEKSIYLLFLALFVLEFLLMSRVAGFLLRYFFHWKLIFIFLISLSSYQIFRFFVRRLSLQLFIVISIPILLATSFYSLKRFKAIYLLYLPGGANYHQTQYARGKSTISDWVRLYFPETYPIITWCNQLPSPQHLSIIDPDLLWFTPEAQFPIFLTQCRHSGLNTKAPVYLVTLDKCDRKMLPKRNDYEDDTIYAQRLHNRELVCKSKLVMPNLYLLP